MGKISDFYKKQKNHIKEIYITYTGTIIAAILMTVVFVVYNHIKTVEIYNHSIIILSLYISWIFFFESYFHQKTNNKLNRIIMSGIGIIVSVVLDIVFNSFSEKSDIANMNVSKAHILYIIFFVCLGLFIVIRKQKIEFSEYAARVIFGLLRTIGLFATLYLATLLILNLFDALIMDIDYWDYLYDIELLLCGFIYFPSCLITLLNVEEDNSKFTKGFVNYALMPCVMIALIIIYLYIFKIFFTRQIPSNEIFDICSILFAICAPIWTMAYAFTKDKYSFYTKIIKYMKYIYSPFLFLEIYSIGVRISEYGLTESRYVAIMFIIFQIIYIFWELIIKISDVIKKREKRKVYGINYEYLIPVFVVLVFIGIGAPGINATYASYISQKSIFEKNIDYDDNRAAEAMEYLLYSNEYGSRYIKDNYSEEYILRIFEKKNINAEIHWKHVYFTDYPLDRGLDIKEYDKIYNVSCDVYDEEISEDTAKSYKLQLKTSQNSDIPIDNIVIDLSDNLQSLQKIYDDQIDNDECPYIIDVSNDEDNENIYSLCIYNANFSYSEEIQKYKDISLDAYLLQKMAEE